MPLRVPRTTGCERRVAVGLGRIRSLDSSRAWITQTTRSVMNPGNSNPRPCFSTGTGGLACLPAELKPPGNVRLLHSRRIKAEESPP